MQTVSQEKPLPSLERILGFKPKPPKLDLPRGTATEPSRVAARRRFLTALTGGPASPLQKPRRTPRVDPILALVNRITQGFNLAEYQRARTLGYDAYLEEQLDHLSIDDSDMDTRLANYATLNLSPKQIIDNYSLDPNTPFFEFKAATLERSVHSKRQLFERMCEFWNDHFSIDSQKDPMYAFHPENDLLVTRTHALGNFVDMLRASAHSGAMLYYLDNWLNVAGNVQENYSREIQELHSLSVNGPYTEMDIVEVAKCLTGWGLELDFNSPDYLRGLFTQSNHQGGTKTVLGNVIDELPHRQQLNKVVDILGAHPSTADFISRKMIKWLLTPNPSQALVDSVAAVYTSTGGDIKDMIREILKRENIKGASAVMEPIYKRPFHLMTSLLRGIGADMNDPPLQINLLAYLYFMGHGPFNRVTPDGYPITVDYWGTSPLTRWTYISNLLENLIPGVNIHFLQIPGMVDAGGPNGHKGLAKRINKRLLGRALTEEDEQIVQQYINSIASPLSNVEVREAIALAASAPGYQFV